MEAGDEGEVACYLDAAGEVGGNAVELTGDELAEVGDGHGDGDAGVIGLAGEEAALLIGDGEVPEAAVVAGEVELVDGAEVAGGVGAESGGESGEDVGGCGHACLLGFAAAV